MTTKAEKNDSIESKFMDGGELLLKLENLVENFDAKEFIREKEENTQNTRTLDENIKMERSDSIESELIGAEEFIWIPKETISLAKFLNDKKYAKRQTISNAKMIDDHTAGSSISNHHEAALISRASELQTNIQNEALKKEIDQNAQLFSSAATPNNDEPLARTLKIPIKPHTTAFKLKDAYLKTGLSYTCQICPKKRKFFSATSIRQHIKYQHFHLRFECNECNRTYANRVLLVTHYKRRHAGTKVPLRFRTVFTIKFKSKSEADGSKSTNRLKNLKKLRCPVENSFKKTRNFFTCNLCTESLKYSNVSCIRLHIKLQHLDFRFVCAVCSKQYRSSRHLKKHYTTVHNQICPKTLRLEKIPKNSLQDKDEVKLNFENNFKKIENSFICTLCPANESANYARLTNVYHHIKMRHYGYRYVCQECDKQYMQTASLQIHYKNQHNKDCPENLKIQKPSNVKTPAVKLKYENDIKCVDKIYYCTLCEESPKYNLKTSAQTHIKLHHYGYRFACKQCSKTYMDRGSLKKHYKSKHKLEVTESLEMTKCGDTKSQIEKVDNYFKCKQCARKSSKYKTKKSVSLHIKLHHDGYRYLCSNCDAQFMDRTTLKRHSINKHNKDSPAVLKIPTKKS